MTPAALLVALSMTGATGAMAGADLAPGPAPAEAPANRPPAPNIVVPAFHGVALMAVMRTTESILWPEPFARPEQFADHYKEAFSEPPKFDPHQPFMRWDGDPLLVNTVGHGLFGSELYLRARQCRFGWAGSLAFAAATSAVWEYGIEANGARPSAVDLVYTPLAGMALGELRYFIHRAAGGSHSAAGTVVRALVDPFGELERGLGAEC